MKLEALPVGPDKEGAVRGSLSFCSVRRFSQRPLRSGTPLWEDGLCLLRTELRTDRHPQKGLCLRQLVCHLQALFDLAELQQALWNLPAAVLWLVRFFAEKGNLKSRHNRWS